MNINYIPLYISLIALAGSILSSALSYRFQKSGAKKSEAEATEIITQAATALIKPYVEENSKLRAEIDQIRKDLDECIAMQKHLSN